jgi:surfeit locus 1 family protein
MTPVARQRWVLLAAVLLMLLTGRLGVWQLDRADQKLALHEMDLTRSARPVLGAAELAGDEAKAITQHHRRILLGGEWLPDHTIYLENRQMYGRPGFFVMTPLKLPAGDAVLVQRGWLPRDQVDRSRIAPYTTIGGTVQVLARIAPPPSRLAQWGDDAPGAIRQNLDLAALSREIDRGLRPLSLIELPTPDNRGDGLARDWPEPVVDVQKHYGYAAQWFALCALTAGLYVWFQLIRPRRLARAQ